MKAGTSERIGASEKRNRFAPAGMMSSLKKSLIPSAIGCRIPYGPTSIGPMRSCIQLKTFRSARVRKATVSRTVTITMVILTTAAPAKTSISIRYLPPSAEKTPSPSPSPSEGGGKGGGVFVSFLHCYMHMLEVRHARHRVGRDGEEGSDRLAERLRVEQRARRDAAQHRDRHGRFADC